MDAIGSERSAAICRIRPAIEDDQEFVLAVERENALVGKPAFDDSRFRDNLWKGLVSPPALLFVVEDVMGRSAGYCRIDDIAKECPELAVEILQGMFGKGIGTEAIRLLMREVSVCYGKTSFRSHVDPENLASIAMHRKLHARFVGLKRSFMFSSDEEALEWGLAHARLVDGNVVHIAEMFGVEPFDLLSNLLEFELRPEWADMDCASGAEALWIRH